MVAQELNKSPFFKIIIPNYNNGKYIEACLNSILKQTFQEFEIIIIDDVSDDNSVEIINKYCKEYSNIHSILLKEKRWNGGSRNLGIDFKSSAPYTLFIDSDDEFDDSFCLDSIYKIIIANNYPDCIRLSYNWCGDEKRSVILTQSTPADLVAVCDVACWTKCIKTELIQHFPENTFMEDVVQHIAKCDVLQTVVPCLKPIVNWNRNNPTSCSTNPNIQNGKWLSSMYRYCADLMDLQCKTSYCEAHRVYRMETAQKDIKNNITRQ